MRQYLIVSCLITLGLMGLFYFGNEPLLSSALHIKFPGVVFFFFLQSIIIALMIRKGEQTNWEGITYTLGIIAFRFITCLFFLLLLMIMKLPNLNTLLLQFIGVYLVYLVFELFTVLSNLRRN